MGTNGEYYKEQPKELKALEASTNKSASVSLDSNILLIQWTTASQSEY